MRHSFKSSFSRVMALLGLLGVGLAQVGCAHPVVVEPSVSVHSRIGHFPVYTQVGVPGPVIYAPPPRVIYAPPPPRVVYSPRVYAPAQIWGHGHERGHRGQEGRHHREEERERGGGWRGQRDQWRH
ncbi:hypothetical protein [Limnohabitans sp. 2KL-1]|uniref:hypothetical protein n=1 Tax=Limnohabitans sp. 2KL-1 TaxID=1100699 RepID=UPI001E5F04D4|nr:hypothetical protein [Limnohabitans sp. 2KL-1]